MKTAPREDSSLRTAGDTPSQNHAPLLFLWAVLIFCVIIGSLLPTVSPVVVGVGRLHINDKLMHFCAYLMLSLLPVIGLRERRRGIAVGLSMFVLGVLLEGGQHFAAGRAPTLGDVIANGVGVSCGVLLAMFVRGCGSLRDGRGVAEA